MAAKQNLRWLISEIEELGRKAVIDAGAVMAIKNHYQPQLEKDNNFASKAGVAILAAIGTLLIGGGVILVFAHNWQEFSRPVRAMLAILPKVVCTLSNSGDLNVLYKEGLTGKPLFWYNAFVESAP